MSTVADCEHCGRSFEVPNTLAGGFSNCPDCGKATSVGGLNDPLWRVFQLGGLAIAVGIGIAVTLSHGPTAGLTAGVAAALGLWLISRAL